MGGSLRGMGAASAGNLGSTETGRLVSKARFTSFPIYHLQHVIGHFARDVHVHRLRSAVEFGRVIHFVDQQVPVFGLQEVHGQDAPAHRLGRLQR